MQVTKAALRRLARRHQQLTEEIRELDAELAPLVTTAAPTLLALPGVGIEVASQLLSTAEGNPERLRSEAAFAHLCGVAPIQASFGRTHRHRLNRGGDRQANAALHTIALSRLRWDPRSRAYLTRRQQQGLTKPEADALPQAIHRPRGLPTTPQHPAIRESQTNSCLTNHRSIVFQPHSSGLSSGDEEGRRESRSWPAGAGHVFCHGFRAVDGVAINDEEDRG